MNLHDMVDNLSLEMYERLKHGAETGRWPEGTALDEKQKSSALQLIMAYQARHLSSNEILTIGSDGEIINKTKRELRDQFSDSKNIARFSKL